MGSEEATSLLGSSAVDESLLPPDGQQRLLHRIFEFWANPEIERRRIAGTLPPGFALVSAQVIMNIGQPTVVRLNEEVQGGFHAIPNADVVGGEQFYWDQVQEIRDFQLTGADPNAGHFTIFWTGKGWLIFFDCRYNASKVGELLKAADEFLATAAFARERAHNRAFLENLFAAAELTAKARLILLPDEKILKSKKHAAIASRINLEARYGNVDKTFVAVLNDLGRRRGEGRYVEGGVALKDGQMVAMLATVGTMLEASKTNVPKRFALSER
jgi:hypothetical protein